MEKQEFVQLLKDNKVVNLSTTTDSAVAAVAPVVTRLRRMGVKGKTLAMWAVEAGVGVKSATSLISDFHAVGSYLKDYPQKESLLTEQHGEKIWRSALLCPARRVHRLKKGASAERDAKAEVLQRHGKASLQVATALQTWKDNQEELSNALSILKSTQYQEASKEEASTVVENAEEPSKEVLVIEAVLEPVVEAVLEEASAEEATLEPEAAVVEEVVPAPEAPKQVAKHSSKKKNRK